MKIALAPMEGLVDAPMREALTRVGGIDWCVTEFVRITQSVLPPRTYRRVAPEMEQQWKTTSGTPLHVQFLGSDPQFLAENAVQAAALGAREIDLNFGCPAKTVNRHRGGAALLKEPELLNAIVSAVRKATPADVKVTAKMRLGYLDKSLMLDCARALDDGGAGHIVVHARTKVEGYRPPAHWACIAQVREVVQAQVIANGDIWTVEDYLQCRRESGCEDVMLGRGLVARPDLALQIRATIAGEDATPLPWSALQSIIEGFYARVSEEICAAHAPGRLKSWLAHLRRSYPQAEALYQDIRTQKLLASVPTTSFAPDFRG